MHERIKSITHQGKQVVLADFSNCSAVEVEKNARAVPEYVTAQPLGSVLMLVDFTGASFDQDALKAMKEGDMDRSKEPSVRIRGGTKGILSA